MRQLPQQAADRALAVLELHRNNLMLSPGVIGAGIGASAKSDEEAAIVIYLDKTAGARAQLARSIDGVPVRVIVTDPFVAL